MEWTALPSARITAVENAGDVSGNGTDDLFAASLETHGHGVFCVDGLTGDVIWHNPEVPGVYGPGCLRAIGDIDFDGIRDVAVGRAAVPSVTVLSGATGEVVWYAPQSDPVRYVETVQGPESGDVRVLVSVSSGAGLHVFRGLNGQTGQQVWASSPVWTCKSFIKVTELDADGNGWPEMGYALDRGSANPGSVIVRDGGTGHGIQTQAAMFHGNMDIGDTPSILVVSQFGAHPTMWVIRLVCGTLLWSSRSENLLFSHLQVIPPVSGYFPDILGWSETQLALIRGDDGYHQDRYNFSGAVIKAVATYTEDSLWRLAVITPLTFHCPPLVFSSPSILPLVTLPNHGGSDLCLLDSDLYPTPLAAVGMMGPGVGLCAISTSWPLGVSGGDAGETPSLPPVTLLSQPGRGGLLLFRGAADRVLVLDIAGRVVSRVGFGGGDQGVFVPLPPGLYHILDTGTGMSLRAAVLSE